MMVKNNVENRLNSDLNSDLNSNEVTCCTTENDSCCAGSTLRFTDAEANELAKICKALSHPVRLQIVCLLNCTADEVCVCDIEAYFSLKQPTISHHLKILRKAGLIECEQRGLWVYYQSTETGLKSLCQKLMA